MHALGRHNNFKISMLSKRAFSELVDGPKKSITAKWSLSSNLSQFMHSCAPILAIHTQILTPGCFFESIKANQISITQYLLEELHFDPNLTDKEGRTPLPDLAKDEQMIKILLKYGARVDNVYERFSYLLGKLATEQPPDNPVPIFLTGDGGVGKSTLLKAMLSSKGFMTNFSIAKPVTSIEEKTVGIIPYEIVTKEFGRVIMYDFAGSQEFYASHCAVLENTVQTSVSPPIIIHLVHLQESDQRIIDSITWWMTLVQNQCTNLKDRAHVIVVGSNADILKEYGENAWSREFIFGPAFNQFPKVEFVAFIPMDCRYPDTVEMKQVKKLVQRSITILRSPETVSLNAHFFYIYVRDSFNTEIAVSIIDVQEQIYRDLNQLQSKRNLLNFISSTLFHLVKICQQLSKRNLIFYFHNEDSPERSLIICDCTTLLSKVTGTVFAPVNFRQHCKLASSTGVVPLSRFSERFKAYSSEMLIAFMSHLELCFEIEDKKVLECVREHEENPEPDGRYLFFPGLIRIETPEVIWEEDPTISCHFGWIIECSQDIQFFDSRCLQVLILRLVFTFGLAPAGKVQKNIPFLQRFCSIWKNGIFWCNDDGIYSHIELSDNGKSFVLKMRSRVLKPEFLIVRSRIIAKVLETVKDFCPNITTVESVIDPKDVIRHPLKPAASLTLFDISDIALAVAHNKDDVKAESRSLTLSQLLQFEPYASFDQDTLQCICSEKNTKKNDKVSDSFIGHFANQVAGYEVIHIYLTILHSNSIKAPIELGSSKQELVHTLETWRDKTEGTYSCLRETLDKYSIFRGRNPLVRTVSKLKPFSDNVIDVTSTCSGHSCSALYSVRSWLVFLTESVTLQCSLNLHQRILKVVLMLYENANVRM